ncbi:MAG: hypothetical protein A3K68_05075 [Euryarchaeota archaeon RBG_16_68_13]|nr:MAG: hypothetical protein A3K68_05075 [Euryarchaeota archaeon RBG_16_68_13]
MIQTTALGGGVVIRSATEPVAANYDYGAIWLKDRGGGQGDVISILGKNALGNKAWQWTAELV